MPAPIYKLSDAGNVFRSLPSDSFQLRSAIAADAERIAQVHFAAVHGSAAGSYPQEILKRWSPPVDEARIALFRKAIEGGKELFVVAEDRDGVRGFGSVVPMMSELRAVYVDPPAGRHGIGSAILKHLEEAARQRGVLRLEMDVSLNAEPFYLHNGYTSVERSMHRLSGGGVMPCVKMFKDLTAADGRTVLNYGTSADPKRNRSVVILLYAFVFVATSIGTAALCVFAFTVSNQNLNRGLIFGPGGNNEAIWILAVLIFVPWLLSGLALLAAIRRRRQR